MSIGANRFKSIRAAFVAIFLWQKLAREHNNANILILGERLIGKTKPLPALKLSLIPLFLKVAMSDELRSWML